MDSSTTRIPQLDGVRGLAILLVLIWHYAVAPLQPSVSDWAPWFKTILGFTWSGVDLFFVLSGFLIGGILLDNRDASNYFKAFYARRIFRIWPIYLVWFGVFLIGLIAVNTVAPHAPFAWQFQQPQPLWAYGSLTQNWTMAASGTFGAPWLDVTWSLAIEEQFYLILPLLIRFLPTRYLIPLLIGLILSAPILRTLLFVTVPHPDLVVYVLTPCRADALLLGVLCAYAMRKPRWRDYFQRNLKALYGLLLIFAGGTAMLALSHSSFALASWGYTWLAGMYATLLVIVMTAKAGLAPRLFKNRTLRWLGAIAYGTYLFHQAFNGLMHSLLLNQQPRIAIWADLIVSLMAVALTLGVALLSWCYFERPLVAVGHQVRYNDSPTEMIGE